MPTSSSGLNTTTIDIGGTRFVTIQMLFDNNSGVTQEIDFNEIFLVDETGGKHAVTKAAKNFGVVDYDNFEFTLKKGKERLFIVTFSGFPKNEQINKFEMEGNIITIL
ncbi:MAG: hypothetical protein HKM28_00150 [Flavobacteriaceae bacterium]|nr:hypothetical protein [Flavobacteriaceae bacterium]